VAADFLPRLLILERGRFLPKPLAPALERFADALERFQMAGQMIIPERLRPEAGRALCIYGDAGGARSGPRKYGVDVSVMLWSPRQRI